MAAMWLFGEDLLECPNCGTPLSRHYFPECGQKAGPINPTLHDFFHDLTHELLHVDSKIFRSMRLLLTRPGFLTREYFTGRKARYVSPLRLYLIFSIAFFSASVLVANEGVFDADEAIEINTLGRALGITETTPEKANAAIADAQIHWAPRVMFVLVPVSALLVQLVTRRAGKNYPQHLYFALHVHAAYFTVLTVTVLLDLLKMKPLGNVLSFVQLFFLIGYTLVAFHTAYGGRWPLAAGRTAFVLFTYTLVIVVGTTLAVIAVAMMA